MLNVQAPKLTTDHGPRFNHGFVQLVPQPEVKIKVYFKGYQSCKELISVNLLYARIQAFRMATNSHMSMMRERSVTLLSIFSKTGLLDAIIIEELKFLDRTFYD